MAEAEFVQDLRRYLCQRIDAGERVAILPVSDTEAPEPASSPGAASRARSEHMDVRAARVTSEAEARMAGAERPPQGTFPAAGAGRPGGAAAAAATAAAGDSLAQVAAEIRACTKCRLHATRTQAVPGVGPERAGLVCVGEGPGADEDAQGEPFVGRAGQLLNKILAAVHLRRDEVYITNIVKCRPPENRDPLPDEVAACQPYLERQLRLLEPRVICALGRHAASALLGTQESLSKLRAGRHFYRGIRVFPTYHPAALLRNPQWKRPVWEDIQKVRRAVDGAAESP